MSDFVINYAVDLINDNTVHPATVVLKLFVSLILGIVIGGERQMRGRDAGLRTFTLICVGATVAMLISIWIPQIYPNFLNGDPGRIAAQVITGIGFLGAGAIVQGKGSVQGLTTAASIWQVAVIGMAVGAGLYAGAIVATLCTIFLLSTVERLEKRLFIDGANRILTLKCATSQPDIKEIKAIIEKQKIRVGSFTFSADFTEGTSTVALKVTLKSGATDQITLAGLLGELPYVNKVTFAA